MTQMLDLGMFSEFEKTIMQENKIKQIRDGAVFVTFIE